MYFDPVLENAGAPRVQENKSGNAQNEEVDAAD